MPAAQTMLPRTLKNVNTEWRIPLKPATSGVNVRTIPMNRPKNTVSGPNLSKKRCVRSM